MPTTLTSMVLFVLFVVPGLAFISSVRKYMPGRRLTAAEFVMYSLFASTVAYALLFVCSAEAASKAIEMVQTDLAKADSADLSVSTRYLAKVFVGVFVVSCILGLVLGRLARSRWLVAACERLGMLGPTTASDWLFAPRAGWVEVRTDTGVYTGHVHKADASAAERGGLVLRKNVAPAGTVVPIRFVFLGNEHDDSKWVEVPHEWVYLPYSIVKAVWAMPVSEKERTHGKGQVVAKARSSSERASPPDGEDATDNSSV